MSDRPPKWVRHLKTGGFIVPTRGAPLSKKVNQLIFSQNVAQLLLGVEDACLLPLLQEQMKKYQDSKRFLTYVRRYRVVRGRCEVRLHYPDEMSPRKTTYGVEWWLAGQHLCAFSGGKIHDEKRIGWPHRDFADFLPLQEIKLAACPMKSNLEKEIEITTEITPPKERTVSGLKPTIIILHRYWKFRT